MNKKYVLITGVLATVIALGVGIYQSNASQAEPELNYEEVKSLVSSQYPGTITEMELEKDNNRAVYEIEIVNKDMEYDLKVDGNSGEIITLKEKILHPNEAKFATEIIDLDDQQTKKETDTTKQAQKTKQDAKQAPTDKPKEEPKQETKVDKNPNTTPVKESKKTIIDASEAIQIAQKQFSGTVTDIELDEEDGRLIYEIEIDGKNGEEADFEIDAMTGEIIVIEIDD